MNKITYMGTFETDEAHFHARVKRGLLLEKKGISVPAEKDQYGTFL